MERIEAISEGLGKYNTGRACRNGHFADRYTQSGTCVECLNAARVANPSLREAIKADTAEIKLFVTEADWPQLQRDVLATCRYRWPGAAPSAFTSKRPILRSPCAGMMHVQVRVPREDVEAIYALGRMLLAARAAPVERVVMAPATPTLPDWTERP